MHSYSVLLSTAISATPPPLLVYIPQPQERGLDMPQRTHRLPIVGCIPATGRSAICALSLLPTGYELDRPEVSGLHGSVCQTPPAGSAGDYASFPCLHFQFPYSLAFDSNIALTVSPLNPIVLACRGQIRVQPRFFNLLAIPHTQIHGRNGL